MKKGFTLIELLAVIIILAIIALIAVPMVLDIINDSKIKSLKLSTDEYIDIVSTTLVNEEATREIPDGLYTITDDGKKIKYKDIEIDINHDGNGLKSGLILIKDGEIKRVLKGMIEDYYVRVNGSDIILYKNLNESALISGSKFNVKIKELVGDKDINAETGEEKELSINTVDEKVKKIEFLQDSVLPLGYTKETLTNLPSVDVSKNEDESIIAYYDGEGIVYIYSDYYIYGSSDLGSIFQNFKGVEEIDLNSIDTSKVTNMGDMFLNCIKLKELELIGFATDSVTSMWVMFGNCSSLEYLDLSDFKTSNVTTMHGLFAGCSGLKRVDVSSFDLSKATDMAAVFVDCSSLEYLDLSKWDTSNVVHMGDWNGGMFMRCKNLKEIKGIEDFDTSNVTTFGGMFSECKGLTSLDLSKWDMRKATNIGSWNGQFFGSCSNLKSIKFGKNFTLENVEDLTNNGGGMFEGCSSLTSLDLSMFNTSKVKTMRALFWECTNLKEIKGIENFDTSNVITMKYMFYDCKSLTSLDLSKWDTSNLTDMGVMFTNCSSLKSIKFSEKFVTSNVTSMASTFSGCNSLEELDLSGFDASGATTMEYLFSNCNSLKSIKFSEKFVTSNVTSMIYMFSNCSNLTDLDLTSFDTAKVVGMHGMFEGCSSLKELDLRSFDINNVSDKANAMFARCDNLTKIKVTEGKWTLESKNFGISTDLFEYV